MKIGFTGTREGMTQKQAMEVADVLFHFVRTIDEVAVHHGCCVGADDDFHKLAKWLGLPIYLHPPENDSLVVVQHFIDVPESRIEMKKPYLERNKRIVECTDVLIATPKSVAVQKGGTWHTINCAAELNRERYVIAP